MPVCQVGVRFLARRCLSLAFAGLDLRELLAAGTALWAANRPEVRDDTHARCKRILVVR